MRHGEKESTGTSTGAYTAVCGVKVGCEGRLLGSYMRRPPRDLERPDGCAHTKTTTLPAHPPSGRPAMSSTCTRDAGADGHGVRVCSMLRTEPQSTHRRRGVFFFSAAAAAASTGATLGRPWLRICGRQACGCINHLPACTPHVGQSRTPSHLRFAALARLLKPNLCPRRAGPDHSLGRRQQSSTMSWFQSD